MTALVWVQNIAFLIHILAIIGLMTLLLMQIRKPVRRIHPGALHSALTALLAGLVMVGVRTPLNSEDPDRWPLLDNGRIGIKFTILLVILILGYRNVKKKEVKNSIWIAMIALTTANILIALF
ncbi:MAG: hypothetical protein AABY37_07955 [Actinomycetota bacterium]